MQKLSHCKVTGPESKTVRNAFVSLALPPFPGWRWPTASSLTCTYKGARNKSSLCNWYQMTVAPAPRLHPRQLQLFHPQIDTAFRHSTLVQYCRCFRCFIMFDGFLNFELNIQPSWLGLAHVLPNTRGASPPMSRAWHDGFRSVARIQPRRLVVGCGFCTFGDPLCCAMQNSQQHCIAMHLLLSHLCISLPHQQKPSEKNFEKTKQKQKTQKKKQKIKTKMWQPVQRSE